MRNLLLVIALGAGCAARPTRPTSPVQYSCFGASVVRDGTTIHFSDLQRDTQLGWHDSDGDHFVAWPTAPTDAETVELVVPNDPRKDAVQRFYDAARGSSTADWRLVRSQVCTARGGYNDVLARWMGGATLDQLTTELALSDRDEARDLVHHALRELQRRYWEDR